MSELRQDPVVRRWVAIAPRRAERPSDFSSSNEAALNDGASKNPAFSEDCPFCPGKEDSTPLEVLAFRNGHQPQDWQLRVIPNLYPVLQPYPEQSDTKNSSEKSNELRKSGASHLMKSEASPASEAEEKGLFQTLPGAGAHEVVIESRNHSASWGKMSVDDLAEVFLAWRERWLALSREKWVKAVQIFKNRGVNAGASISHPHSQIVALPMVPPVLQEKLDAGKSHWRRFAACIWCEVLEKEMKEKARVVDDSGSMLVLAPWAPRAPFECWILPRNHSAHFTDLNSPQLKELAVVTRRLFRALDAELDCPDLNVMLHTAPAQSSDLQHFHWHLEILPSGARLAGLEQGAGVHVNPVFPEDSAEKLRKRLKSEG